MAQGKFNDGQHTAPKMKQYARVYNPVAIMLGFGTNDRFDSSNYETEARDLLEMAYDLKPAGCRLILTRLTDCADGDTANMALMQDAVVADFDSDHPGEKIFYSDNRTALGAWPGNPNFADDGHPSASGSTLAANTVLSCETSDGETLVDYMISMA